MSRTVFGMIDNVNECSCCGAALVFREIDYDNDNEAWVHRWYCPDCEAEGHDWYDMTSRVITEEPTK